MEFINPADVKTVKKAREHLVTLQQRILDAENLLDDLARCVEIASISRQFQLTDVFVEQSMELAKILSMTTGIIRHHSIRTTTR